MRPSAALNSLGVDFSAVVSSQAQRRRESGGGANDEPGVVQFPVEDPVVAEPVPMVVLFPMMELFPTEPETRIFGND